MGRAWGCQPRATSGSRSSRPAHGPVRSSSSDRGWPSASWVSSRPRWWVPAAASGEAGSDQATCEGTSFGASTRLSSVSVPVEDDWEPALSADGLELFLASWRAGGKGQSDIWRATRTSLTATFSTPVPVAEVNSAAYDAHPWIAADGRTLLFVSDRGGQHNGIYVALRSGPGASFSQPTELSELMTAERADDWAPVLVDGGLRLYFSSSRSSSKGKLDIWVTTRASTSASFGAPENLSALNTASDELMETISADGKELFFSSNRPGGAGMLDLYVVSLTAPASPVGSPRNLTALNTSRDDLGAALSPNGLEILYNRNAVWDTGGQDSDIWTSTRSCAP